jgi:hypothetical protein
MTACARVAGIPPGRICGSGSGAGCALRTVSLVPEADDFARFFFDVGAAIAVVQMQQTNVVHSGHCRKKRERPANFIALIV